MSDLSAYYLGSRRDGQCDLEEFIKKSETGKIIVVHEDATNYIYEDVEYIEVASLYAEVCANQGMYLMREVGSGNDNIRRFECEVSDSELSECKVVCAYDKDGDVIYAFAYLDCDENDIFATSETIGKQNALSMLKLEIDGDDAVVSIDK